MIAIIQAGAIILTLVLLAIGGGAITAAFRSAHQARNGSAQVQNMSMVALHDLFNDCLRGRQNDQQRIDALQERAECYRGTISRAASSLRDLHGRHVEHHAGRECPFFEYYQGRVEVIVLAMEQAVEGGDG